MKNTIYICALTFAFSLTVGAAVETNDWENLSVNSVNRLPARTYTMPLSSVEDALSDTLEAPSPYKVSLNGIWRISWAGNPELRVKDFWKKDFDDANWHTIDVPSCVEMRGFGSPGYVNVRYPHAMAWPKILNRQAKLPDYNPVSSYRRHFTVPEKWAGRQIILRFDGVYSAYYVWVNGKKVGYAEDSKLPSEFDITDYVNAGGSNLLAVEVYRWCDGSYLEDQDMFRYSGIFRDVTLWSKPKDGLWDFSVKTKIASDWKSARLDVAVDGADANSGVEAALYDAAKNKVGDLKYDAAGGTFALEVAKVDLWSAEKPVLYTLVVKKGSDIRRKRIGFKDQKIVGSVFYVNGKAIKFKGVNRHECNPDNARTVSVDDMIRDVTLMKRYNINTVRTSHYPNHHLWYDICDRYGIYLVAEANVEGHEAGYREKGLGRFPEWQHSILERNLRHVVFYRNHPSITIWSMGNETGHGICFKNTIAEVKKLDPSRPTHWERGNEDADIDSRMYPSVEWLEERGRIGDNSGEQKPGAVTIESTQTPGKCFFLCEYAHAMGNSIGNFQEYWDAFYRYKSLSGGCIWDWIDQAVWKYTDRIDPDTGKRERYLAYGGDFDEEPNDGPFCCNGVIDPERKVTAKLIEVGHVHRNLVVTRKDDGKLEIENRFGFTSADEFAGSWSLTAAGKRIASGVFEVPAVAPLSKAIIDPSAFIPKSAVQRCQDQETFLEINFNLNENTLWAEKGWPVSRNQVPYHGKWNFQRENSSGAGQVVIKESNQITVKAGPTVAVFSRSSGTLCELVMNGRLILKDADGITAGPVLTCMRAFTDNDIYLRGVFNKENDNNETFYLSGLTQLRYHARPIKVGQSHLEIVTDVTGSRSAGFVHAAKWSFFNDGSFTVENTVTPHGSMPKYSLPRLGLSFKLNRALEKVVYYGRGPRENYIDRLTGSFFKIWHGTVTGMYEEYVRPQDNGYRSDVRWAAFTDYKGRGVKFSASEPMYVQALHYGVEDLEFARHRNGQQRFRAPLVPREEVCLNLDVRQLGLGGGSCGPIPMKKYIFPVETVKWTLFVEPQR